MADPDEQVILNLMKEAQKALAKGQDGLAISLLSEASENISESVRPELRLDVLYLWSQTTYVRGDRVKGIAGMERLVGQAKDLIPQDSGRLLAYLGSLNITYTMERDVPNVLAIQNDLLPLIMQELVAGNLRAARALDEIVKVRMDLNLLDWKTFDDIFQKASAAIVNSIGEDNDMFIVLLNIAGKYYSYARDFEKAMLMFGNAYSKALSLFGDRHKLTVNLKANFEDSLEEYKTEMRKSKN